MTDNRFDLVSALVAGCSDAPCFKTEPVPAEVLEQIIVAATRHSSERFPEPPWRFVIVVGEERERLIAGVTEALARHWGLGTVRPRGLASQSVLRAPAFILVFSRIPASEGLEALVHVASVAQNVVLLCASHGLATHRTHGSQLVPEAVLELVGDHLGPGIRGGDLVAMLAVGYPEEPGPEPAAGARPDWIGLSFAPQEERNEGLPPPPSTPAAVLRSAGDERVLVVDPYQYNRDLFHRVLSAAGYDVEVFSEGRTLLARLAGGDPAKLYIVSDSLPDMSGFELVRSLRGRAVSAALVATTARRDSAFRIGGLAAGVDYYLRKPINPIELYTAVRILLDRQRRGEDLARANAELSRLLVELRAAQARLVQQAKMASLGELVAGVAHEINTPLGAVVSNNDLFLRCFGRLRSRVSEVGLAADPMVARDLAAVEDLAELTRTACARITGIVRGLRTFARLDEADRNTVDLHEGIESTLLLLNHLLKGRIEVKREYGQLPAIECHPNQLNQVFMNLLVNACHAIEGSGRITIRTSHGAASGTVRVTITDTGHGIPAELFGRIFDPGFTTKGAGVGTGLGLSICYQIVEAHRGEIVVESEVGKGASFQVTLPVCAEPAAT